MEAFDGVVLWIADYPQCEAFMDPMKSESVGS
jgi:hypothetical protein